jgi:excinuclease ABC subunit C
MTRANDQPRFDRFGRSQWIGACRSRLQTLTLADNRREVRRQLRRQCPTSPGVYGMVDASGQLIYVGKAKSLRHRLLSYFAAGADEQKSTLIGRRAVQLVWELVSHEFAALVRELELIRRFRPRCNVQGQPGRVRRGYLCFDRSPAPRAFLSPTLPPSIEHCYGPLLIGRRMRRAVERLNTVFQLRDCSDDVPMYFADERLSSDVPIEPLCTRFDIGLCLAPCAGRCDRSQYDAAVLAAVELIEGRGDGVLQTLRSEMSRAARERQFERAVMLRDTLDDLRMIQLQVAHLGAVKQWAFVYCPPSKASQPTWYFIRHGMPVAAIRQPRTAEQAQRARDLIAQWLGGTDGVQPALDRESLPYILLVARWFHFSPQEHTHTLTPAAAREVCERLMASPVTLQ